MGATISFQQDSFSDRSAVLLAENTEDIDPAGRGPAAAVASVPDDRIAADADFALPQVGHQTPAEVEYKPNP